jgi:hypothetical protein
VRVSARAHKIQRGACLPACLPALLLQWLRRWQWRARRTKLERGHLVSPGWVGRRVGQPPGEGGGEGTCAVEQPRVQCGGAWFFSTGAARAHALPAPENRGTSVGSWRAWQARPTLNHRLGDLYRSRCHIWHQCVRRRTPDDCPGSCLSCVLIKCTCRRLMALFWASAGASAATARCVDRPALAATRSIR